MIVVAETGIIIRDNAINCTIIEVKEIRSKSFFGQMQGDINTGLLKTETEDDDAMKPSESDILSQPKKKPTIQKVMLATQYFFKIIQQAPLQQKEYYARSAAAINKRM